MAELAGRCHVTHHQGQCLVGAMLALPQQADSSGITRITGQLESPQSLDGHDFARQ